MATVGSYSCRGYAQQTQAQILVLGSYRGGSRVCVAVLRPIPHPRQACVLASTFLLAVPIALMRVIEMVRQHDLRSSSQASSGPHLFFDIKLERNRSGSVIVHHARHDENILSLLVK